MNTKTVEEWVSGMTDICAKHFPSRIMNVSVFYIGGRWSVTIESPKVASSHEEITSALAGARSQVDKIINGQNNLARTLGLEAAE